MKAIVCSNYGPPEVLQFKEMEKPVPKDNEILIRVYAVYIGIEDIMQRNGKPYFGRIFIGLTKPRKPVLGTEFAGEIEAVGKNVTLFKKGDSVFGVTGAGFGCYAEYMCMPESGLLSIKPPELSDKEAAPVCGALAAWNLLKAIANIQRGQRVLIYGASGNIGLSAVKIAYIILDASGKPSTLKFKNSLSNRGFYLTTYPTIAILFQTFLTSRFNSKKVVFSATGLKPVSERLTFLKEIIKLFKEGKLKTIIDQSFPLEQMVEAHRYLERGLERGNVVVTI